MTPNDTPQIMPTTPLHERVLRWMNDTALGQAFFHWYGKTRGGLQLRRRSRSLQTIPSPGLVVELPYRWKRQTYPPVVDWTTESEAFTQALARALETEQAPL